jgi:xylulokinase
MYLLGFDIGTSSVKASLVDAVTGSCIASDFFPKVEAPIKALKSGWAEQAPDSWWQYIKQATAAILAATKVAPADIKAIGFSYQMHGLVMIDRQGEVIRDAII